MELPSSSRPKKTKSGHQQLAIDDTIDLADRDSDDADDPDSDVQHLSIHSNETPQVEGGSGNWTTVGACVSLKSLMRTQNERSQDGLFGWLVVIASFLVHLVILGTTFSFGVYFREYLNVFDAPASQLSFIGTLAPGIFTLLGAFTGRLADKFGPRPIAAIGFVLYAVALLLASLAQEVWHLLLTQGVLLGAASSFAYFPVVALVPTWFNKRRGIATGVSLAGTGVGGFVISPMTQALISAYDWRVSLRVLALAGFLTLSVAWFLLFQRIPGGKKGPIFYFDLFRDKSFVILYAGSLSATFGFLLPFFYLSVYAQEVGGLEPSDGAFLIGILNAASGLGRVLLGFWADYAGGMNVYCLCMAIASVSAFCWPLCQSYASIAVFAVFFGFFGGGFISLTPVVIANYWGTERLSGMIGLFFTSCVLGYFFGVSVGGKIYEATGNNFGPLAYYSGAVMGVAFLCDLVVRLQKEPFKRDGKVCAVWTKCTGKK